MLQHISNNMNAQAKDMLSHICNKQTSQKLNRQIFKKNRDRQTSWNYNRQTSWKHHRQEKGQQSRIPFSLTVSFLASGIRKQWTRSATISSDWSLSRLQKKTEHQTRAGIINNSCWFKTWLTPKSNQALTLTFKLLNIFAHSKH